MIADVLRLTGWEWFKLRRRWMPWVLVAIAVLISQLGLWMGYAIHHSQDLRQFFDPQSSSSTGLVTEDVEGNPISIDVRCADLSEGDIPADIGAQIERLSEREQDLFLQQVEEFRVETCGEAEDPLEDSRRSFVMPDSITGGINGAFVIGAILVMILAAAATGAEYGWGTLRAVLTRGAGRWQILSSKLLLLLLMTAAGLLVVAVVAAAASLLAAVIPPDETGGLFDSGEWSETASFFGKVVYGLAPYIVLGTFLALLTQSSSVSMAVGLGYYVVELIVAPILRLNESLATVADYLLGQIVNTWVARGSVSVSVSTDGSGAERMPPEPLQAFFVILAYIVVLAAAGFWVFQRRDVAGAKGG